MTLPVYVAFDPGSRRMGAVAGTWTEPTLTIVAVQKIAPKFENENTYIVEASAQALEFAFGNSAAGIIIEIGALYLPRPPKLTGDVVIDTAEVLKHTRACQSISTHHEITKRLADNIARLATAHGIPVQCVSRATWVHRLIPHTSGGMTDAMVLVALPRRVSAEGCALLASKDLRDAAGALLWGFIPASARKRKSRARVADPNKPVVPRVVYTGADATIEAKAKRHRDRALKKKRDTLGTTARLGTPCSCGVQHGKGRRPRTCSQALNSTDQRVVAALTIRPMTARELGETIASIEGVLSRMMREGVVTHGERGGPYSLTSMLRDPQPTDQRHP